MSRRKDHINLVPEETLAYNIFTRLPVKSLGSCKCVLKPWNSLISDPHFIETHLTETLKHNDTTNIILISKRFNPGRFFLLHVDNRISKTCFSFRFEFDRVLNFDCSYTWSRLWGSCNGLILAEDDRRWTSMYLLNPTTLESKILPSLPCVRRHRCVFGFGYDSSCNDYAVVAVVYCQDSTKKDEHVYVYMLKTNKWNKVGLSPYDHKCNKSVAGIYLGGSLHWLAKTVEGSSLLISAFNIANKNFSTVPIPHENLNGHFELGAVNGCLCLIDNVNGHMTELWVMNEYGVAESWMKFSPRPEGPLVILPEDTLVKLEYGMVSFLVINAKEGTFYIRQKRFLSGTNEVGITYVSSLVSLNEKDSNQKSA